MRNFVIVYGEAESPIQKMAIEELTKILLDYTLEYPISIKSGSDLPDGCLPVYIGTRENSSDIRSLSTVGLCAPEEY